MSKEYDEYLTNHIDNVWKGYKWCKDNVPEIFDKIDNIKDFEKQLKEHDKSKWSDEEYDAYDQYFYGKKDRNEFDLAWVHHYSHNKHHPEYWIINGRALDMPYEYIVEMLLDHWTFSWAKSDLTEIFDYYNEHKNDTKLSINTKHIYEYLLNILKNAIDIYMLDN